MDVHDVTVPGRQKLEPGMVITLEPGIYLVEEGLGVRIEDDVLVTPTGAEWLSAKAPRTTAGIERLMRGGRQVSAFSPLMSSRGCASVVLDLWSRASANGRGAGMWAVA